MERELVLLLILGIIVLAFASTRSKKDNRYEKTSYQDVAWEKLQPFDEKSASQQPSNTILKGLAYVVDGDTVIIKKNSGTLVRC